MAGITENIFRHLLESGELSKQEMIAAGRSADDGRIREILDGLIHSGDIISDAAEDTDSAVYRISPDPDIFSRLWLEYPNLRTELQKTPRVLDTIARSRLSIVDDELRSEACDLLQTSPLFFELSLKHPNITGIIAGWDRIITEPEYTFDKNSITAENDPLPAHKIHGFFAYCVFYECMTAENLSERMRMLRSVQENTPTLLGVLSTINRLR